MLRPWQELVAHRLMLQGPPDQAALAAAAEGGDGGGDGGAWGGGGGGGGGVHLARWLSPEEGLPLPFRITDARLVLAAAG